MGHVNVEIKARCNDHERIRKILLEQKARLQGLDHQADTYFRVARGRLKLREGNIENYLVFYDRENKSGPKQSNVTLLETKPNSKIKEMLSKSLGVLVVVDKRREIYWIDNVKFHLDEVVGLGAFVEIEAIDFQATIGIKKLEEQCSHYMNLLGISSQDLVSQSYSDLLMSINLKPHSLE